MITIKVNGREASFKDLSAASTVRDILEAEGAEFTASGEIPKLEQVEGYISTAYWLMGFSGTIEECAEDPNEITYVNLTGHDIVIVDGPTIPPSGQELRVTSVDGEDLGVFSGVPLRKASSQLTLGNLPPRKRNTYYIVSNMVADRFVREDVFRPDTGPDCVRDTKDKKVLAVKRLLRSM